MHSRVTVSIVGLALVIACAQTPSTDTSNSSEQVRLPTGALLDPTGKSVPLGPLPLSLIPSPDGKHFVALLSGYRDNGVQVIDRGTGAVTEFRRQPAAFIGVAFSPDGKRLYASGGDDDAIYVYDWKEGSANIADTIFLAKKSKSGKRYPAGIAVSSDGRLIYAAENLGDSLAVVDVASGRVTQRLATERYPYAVVVSPDGTVYVSAWGGTTVSVFSQSNGTLVPAGRIAVGRHPSALLLNRDGSRLYAAQATIDRIAVVDTKLKKPIAQLADPSPSGPSEGSTPNALALSPDESRLFVAEADNNAVAVFDLTSNNLLGRILVEWYPAGVYATRDSLFVANAKGKGTAANPGGPNPLKGRGAARNYTLGQISGTLSMIELPGMSDLAPLTARVAHANGWDQPKRPASYPPIEHVIYIIKENRTYDQILGDLTQADGDTSLLFFPRSNTPNHHTLAERFGIFDRFFVNAEVSADGHNWSTAAYASDYVEKTVPLNYGNGGRTYDYEGTNRDKVPDDDVASPGSGYLWDLAHKAGITYRNYGEFVDPLDFDKEGTKAPAYEANKPNLVDHTNRKFPGYSLQVKDQVRADVW
ncbi:MAG TPA: beta-propeller fold lactonase family protein, partial [Gemmatimonadaceae bacterium]|nr:beta-propeller fold lactonase family protein [Gemmatimonadaceae bacterium]